MMQDQRNLSQPRSRSRAGARNRTKDQHVPPLSGDVPRQEHHTAGRPPRENHPLDDPKTRFEMARSTLNPSPSTSMKFRGRAPSRSPGGLIATGARCGVYLLSGSAVLVKAQGAIDSDAALRGGGETADDRTGGRDVRSWRSDEIGTTSTTRAAMPTSSFTEDGAALSQNEQLGGGLDRRRGQVTRRKKKNLRGAAKRVEEHDEKSNTAATVPAGLLQIGTKKGAAVRESQISDQSSAQNDLVEEAEGVPADGGTAANSDASSSSFAVRHMVPAPRPESLPPVLVPARHDLQHMVPARQASEPALVPYFRPPSQPFNYLQSSNSGLVAAGPPALPQPARPAPDRVMLPAPFLLPTDAAPGAALGAPPAAVVVPQQPQQVVQLQPLPAGALLAPNGFAPAIAAAPPFTFTVDPVDQLKRLIQEHFEKEIMRKWTQNIEKEEQQRVQEGTDDEHEDFTERRRFYENKVKPHLLTDFFRNSIVLAQEERDITNGRPLYVTEIGYDATKDDQQQQPRERFTIVKELGQGGYGAVYAVLGTKATVRHDGTQTTEALKDMGIESGAKEIVNHLVADFLTSGVSEENQERDCLPKLWKVLCYSNKPGRIALVMEQFAGTVDGLLTQALGQPKWDDSVVTKMSNRLGNGGGLPMKGLAHIARCFAQWHKHDFFHGDFHADNVGMKHNGQLIMLDFGLSGIADFPDYTQMFDVRPFNDHIMAGWAWPPEEASIFENNGNPADAYESPRRWSKQFAGRVMERDAFGFALIAYGSYTFRRPGPQGGGNGALINPVKLPLIQSWHTSFHAGPGVAPAQIPPQSPSFSFDMRLLPTRSQHAVRSSTARALIDKILREESTEEWTKSWSLGANHADAEDFQKSPWFDKSRLCICERVATSLGGDRLAATVVTRHLLDALGDEQNRPQLPDLAGALGAAAAIENRPGGANGEPEPCECRFQRFLDEDDEQNQKREAWLKKLLKRELDRGGLTDAQQNMLEAMLDRVELDDGNEESDQLQFDPHDQDDSMGPVSGTKPQ
ncbi:unnamed protein product, partial [Amoebophrya sp. A120]|eukprot:GSA120T00007826001.1